MSSPSDTDSDLSEHPQRVQSLPQIDQNEPNETLPGRPTPNINSFSTGHDHTWTQRGVLGYGAVASSSTPLLRSVSSNQPETSRYTVAPFSMANMSVEARRQNIMAMDRKRRLTGSNHDAGARRRNLAGGFNERDDTIYNHSTDIPASSSRPSADYQRSRSSPHSTTEVIDLTNSPPPAANSNRNLTARASASTPGIYVVPRWQPDSEVVECPICKRPFTFLFRRHHCRKCGRVVCNDCSPHRITIPRQFIVNPPGPFVHSSPADRETVDLTGDDDDDEDEQPQSYSGLLRQYYQAQNMGIGGGEKVRLCNPCVPDPQPEPQPNYTSNTLPSTPASRSDDLLTLSDALRGSRHNYHASNSTETFPRFPIQHNLPFPGHSTRTRPLPLLPQSRGEDGVETPRMTSFSYSSNDHHRQRGHMSVDALPAAHHRHHSSETSRIPPQPTTTRPRIRSMLEESYLPRMFAGNAPVPRLRLSEEDICPICRRALPPKGLNGDESAREAHIIECISARDPSTQSSTNRASGSVQSLTRGPMHMLPFVATEKDCVGDDGNTPECSICMVEYDVGDELARLECLCKFHRECISEWFMRKQECPVHKVS